MMDRLSLQCCICNKTETLVRDHNHITGNIIGILCAKCNSYIHLYLNGSTILKKRYVEWLETFSSEIEEYISNETDIPYRCCNGDYRSVELLRKMRKNSQQSNAKPGTRKQEAEKRVLA